MSLKGVFSILSLTRTFEMRNWSLRTNASGTTRHLYSLHVTHPYRCGRWMDGRTRGNVKATGAVGLPN